MNNAASNPAVRNYGRDMYEKGYSKGYRAALITSMKVKNAKADAIEGRFKEILDYIQTRKENV